MTVYLQTNLALAGHRKICSGRQVPEATGSSPPRRAGLADPAGVVDLTDDPPAPGMDRVGDEPPPPDLLGVRNARLFHVPYRGRVTTGLRQVCADLHGLFTGHAPSGRV